MSVVGRQILKAVVLVVGDRRPHTEAPGRDPWADYIGWQFESTRRLLGKLPPLELAGNSVLEIGCGTGGRAAFLAANGAKHVLGIDINAAEIDIAREKCPKLYPETSGVLEFRVSSEDAPLEIGQFDIVVLFDTMEHVVSPPRMMRLAHSYTKRGGRFLFSSIGWYHHAGSHTGLFPFVNVLFDDETILDVIRWKVSRRSYVPTRFDSDPPVEQWRGVYDLRDRPGEHLNKLTLRDVARLTRNSVFSEGRMHVVGFGERSRLWKLLDPLRHVPGIQEVYHSLVVGDFRK